MKAAIAHGQRPSVLILGKGSKKPKSAKGYLRALYESTVWDRTDIVFGKAYQRFLNELCAQCGLPRYICHNEDNRIQFDLHTDSCAAMAKVEREQKNRGDADHFGERLIADPYLTDKAKAEGLELSDFRRPFLRELARKRGLLEPED